MTIDNYFNVLSNIRWRKPPFGTKAEMFRKEDLRAPFPASESIIFAETIHDHRPYWAAELQAARTEAGLSRGNVSERVVGSRSGACWNWEAGIRFPEEHHWDKLRRLFPSLPTFDAIAHNHETGRRPFLARDDAPYTDVWDFPTVNVYPGKHPCEKPALMADHIVMLSSRPGDVVLDCFAGSGWIPMSCKRLGRRCIAVEQDEHWCRYMASRLAQGVLFGASA